MVLWPFSVRYKAWRIILKARGAFVNILDWAILVHIADCIAVVTRWTLYFHRIKRRVKAPTSDVGNQQMMAICRLAMPPNL